MSNKKRKTAARGYTAPQAKGYSDAGASFQRRAMRGFNAQSGSPNEDINWNNDTLRQRSRMLYMSAPLATSAIKTNRSKVVGSGLALKCDIDREALGMTPEQAKAWSRHTEAEFRLWAERRMNCDATGINNFAGLQQLVLMSWLQSGDVFALVKRYDPTPLNPYSLRLHLVEADRISTPTKWKKAATTGGMTDGRVNGTGNRIFDGVEVNDDGLVVAYHIASNYPTEITNTTLEWTRVKAVGEKTGLPNILHVMNGERPEQYRGVPYLAAVIEPLLQLRRYTDSQLMAALVQSFFTAWITTNTDPNAIPINEVGGGNIAGIPTMNDMEESISDSENEYEMGPGTITHLQDGENITFGNPQIPTAGFDTFVATFCQLIGAALEIPYEVLLKRFDSSYSASRGALLEAWEGFKIRRTWLTDQFCQPVYEIWLSEAVALGRVKAPGFFDDPRIRAEWCKARWIGPTQGQLDPLKEAKAAVLKINHAIATHAEVTREMGGGDWDSNVEVLAGENERLAAADIRNFAQWEEDIMKEEDDDI